jgi:allophanate hydrolase subunit 2
MGARLRGNKVVMENPISMTSAPLLPGTLQAPPDGQPILALVDGHCTGGYARALQVIRADLWLMGQIGPETQLSFRRSLDEEAAQVLHYRNAFYSRLMPGFKF